ncbi:restriction endonuclease subunit S [Lactobacillus johnsonii]|jgi:type I restriction enzyme S subunit|uniref:restriction endonuclease subunit S n=1 Tax=Lactobacillus johnsonii TaxID=33959 RepID=UPI001072E2CF|nr:restriction endonuclease subunit S [Lactobacillus johnsonii]MBF0771854.1 restriction endonuclease subunit S [Lactobacillus johnsonii]MCF1583721.1 restriction endonuclease subunit S [Lactobacillus johnsonii]MCI9451900.1 restriction endonuclease subunit S [Lactobacillus johnsonii]MDG4988057.1 restriction endonuclease subunit S [Lactobacillus johnsonii]NDO44367.1 restriction endonuclease subunit S [Lactobacillus johnsonii]
MHFPLLVWEQRKFESLIYPEKIKNKNNLQLPAYSISNKNGFIAQTDQFGKDNTYSKTDKKTNYIVNPGAFAYNPARINVGSIGYQNLATPVLVSSLYEVFKTNSQINDLFLIYWFKTDKFFNQIKKYEEGGVRQYYFLDKLLFSEIIIPKDAREQQKISKILKKLDYLFSLQQRKLKLFDQLRKTLLEYLISEQKIPIVRFNSFRKEWKVFRLQNLIIKTTKGKAKADMVGNRSIYLDTAYLNGGALSTVDAPTDVYKDDIVILWDGSLAGKVYHGFSGALGSTLKSFTPKYSGEYLFQYLQRSQEKIFKNYRTPNIPHVVKDFITIFKVNAPSLEEQNKISTILESIDLLIDNQNTKIKKWKKIKEHLLQKMFI